LKGEKARPTVFVSSLKVKKNAEREIEMRKKQEEESRKK